VGRTYVTGLHGEPEPTWEVLDAWSDDWRVVRKLSDGHRNRVAVVAIDGRPYVARLGRVNESALDWEATLLDWLYRCDVGVPALVPTRRTDVRELHSGGCIVMEVVEGHHPESDDDWELVATALRRLHHVSGGWPQRPGSRAAADLLTYEHAENVAVSAMPPDAVRRCRAAWAAVAHVPRTVIHGDPRVGNIRIRGDRAFLLGWDEARVDAPVFDLATLPRRVAGLDAAAWAVALRASVAWEAANRWTSEPTYARRQLDQLRTLS
jgi:Ser/Thr protein kinase RdoA (MazF antagonist)